MRLINFLTTFLTLSILGTSAKSETFTFEVTTRYKKFNESQFTELKAGESIELKAGESAITLSQQGLPLLIFSPQSKNNSIVVKTANYNQLMTEAIQPLMDKTLDEILSALRKAENQIKKRDYQQALSTISPVKEKYKNISSLLFMNGTINYLLNNKNEAIADLEKGLAIDPTEASAKTLLEKLKAGDR